MKYALVITTDGRPDVLANTLKSFFKTMHPKPESAHVVDDSADPAYRAFLLDLLPRYFRRWETVHHPKRVGFCTTVADAWTLAIKSESPWIWWTEDDFIYRRSADLSDLGFVLHNEPKIAQMGLMRQAVNWNERRAGGLYKMYRDRYTPQGAGAVAWLRSRTNFSTGSSLMSRTFMKENPWPAYEKECEGRYSIDLLSRGYEFAVWGTGEPWVEHVGVRSGRGY